MHSEEDLNKTVPESDILEEMSTRSRFVCPQVMEKSSVEVSKTDLPNDMVEKILAMVPFPSVYKARCLAKSWFSRFSAISSQRDEAGRSLAIGFQKQVSEWSHKWETLYPVALAEEDSFAFHWATQSWKRMPSLNFLPEHTVKMHRQMEGPLVLASECCRDQLMYVANVLTRRWKALPVCPLNPRLNYSRCSNYAFCVKLLVNSSSQTYQVIRFCRPCVIPNCFQCRDSLYGSERVRVCSVQLYDSQSDAWTSKELVLPGQFGCAPHERARSVYLDGIIYMVASQEWRNILSYSVEKGRFEWLTMLYHGSADHTESGSVVDLMVCDNTLLMMVSTYGSSTALVLSRVVLKIDLESQELVEVARCPLAGVLYSRAPFTQPVANGDNRLVATIINNVGASSSTMLNFSVAFAQWRLHPSVVPTEGTRGRPRSRLPHHFDTINYSFRPGLIPFMEV